MTELEGKFRKIDPDGSNPTMSDEKNEDRYEPVDAYDNPSYKGAAAVYDPPSTDGATADYKNGSVAINGVGSSSKENEKEEKEEKKDKEADKVVGIRDLFRYATCLDYILMLAGTLFALAHGACLPLLMIVFGDMLDLFLDQATEEIDLSFNATQCDWEDHFNLDVSDLRNDPENYNRVLEYCDLGINPITELVSEMGKYSLYYVYIAIGVVVAAYGQVAFWLMAAYRQARKVRITLFRSILRQDIGWFDTHEAGELNSRLADDVTKIEEGIGDKLGNFFQWFSTFLTGIAIGFAYGWKLCLVILATSPLLVISGGIFGKLSTLATEGELSAYAKAGAVAQEVLSSIRTVFAFSGQEKEAKRYQVRLEDAQGYGIKKSLFNGGSMGAVFFIIYAVYALAFWYGAKLVRDEPENYSGGKILIVFFSVLIGAFALGNAAPNLQYLTTARGAAFFIWDLIDRVPDIDTFDEGGIRPEGLIGNISVRDVKFVYPARPDVQVLNGLSLDVSTGETVALVGHSGCGKSTVVQLLQRFYDPQSGTLQIDGRDVQDYNIKWIRQHIGVVSQEPVLFATTIKENIMFGRENVTMAEIEQATKESNAYDFIMKLPKKFDTLVGERGAQLSGGQKQRIAIARALVRNPKILLLDEATSALDTESEATVQAALDKASQGRTTLVIAHRLSTIKNADVIFGFKDGLIHEKGSHDELMRLGETGIYHKLVTNQKTMDPVQQEIEEEMAGGKGVIRQMSHDMKGAIKRQMSRTVSVGEPEEKHDKEEEEAEEEEKLPAMSLVRVMRMNAPEWLYMVLGCFCAIINGGVQPAFAIIFAEIIGVFAKPVDEQKEEALLWSMMFLVIGVAAGLSMFLQGYMFGISGEKLTSRIRDMVFRTLLKQEVAYFDNHKNSTGALCTRLSADCAAVQGATGARIGTLLMNVAALGTGIIIGFVYSWKLTLCVIAFMPMIAIAGGLQMKILQGTAASGKEALEEAGKIVTECISNMRTVASLTKEDYFYEEYRKQTSIPHKAAMAKSNVIGLTFSISQSLIFFAYAAIFYLGAYLVEEDGLDFVDMFKVFGAIVFGAMAIGQASHFAPDYGKAQASGARIFALLDREPAIDSSSLEGNKPATMKGVIHFKGVQFHYPTRPEVQVLQGLDLDILPGQSVALVGSSGCGKSTTVSLLERFYDASEGEMKLDGTEIRSLNIGWLRSQMAIVQQEPVLFDTSIRENIAYGCLHEATMDEVIKAARDANIHDFVSSLPNGYETNVGDKGTQLSGGQKQRIAIARALIRNPKILLLDEATSALDTESEKIVQDALERAQQGRTSIVIAHRLSTIQNSDCIFVFRNGVVHEKGTHNDLLSSKGIYYKLNMAQQRKGGD